MVALLLTCRAKEGNAVAEALRALRIDCGGQMLLNDFKCALKKAMGDSGSATSVLQNVYGLVALSLINVDRTQAEETVISLF